MTDEEVDAEIGRTFAKRMHTLLGVFIKGMRTYGHESPPISLIAAYWWVVMEPGLCVTEYAAKLGLPTSTTSRHLLDLGKRNRKGEPGMGLVTSRPNPHNRRRLEYMLTPKGRALAEKVGQYDERMRQEIAEIKASRVTRTPPPAVGK
jgi:DNA-binding MarR family transcriptional regulator